MSMGIKKARVQKNTVLVNNGIVEIYTDGGCKPNPGPGGWAAILKFNGLENIISGGELVTTNNRMELTAAVNALETLNRPCRVVVHTDSQYVRNGITSWSAQWVRNNWRTAAGRQVANIDLWQRLLAVEHLHQVKWLWIRGHSGNIMNERVDKIATTARENLTGKKL